MKDVNVSSEILEREDLDEMCEAVAQIYDLEYEECNDQIIKEFWEKLPLSIKLEAVEWGCGDTLVGDHMVEWAQDQGIYKGE